MREASIQIQKVCCHCGITHTRVCICGHPHYAHNLSGGCRWCTTCDRYDQSEQEKEKSKRTK